MEITVLRIHQEALLQTPSPQEHPAEHRLTVDQPQLGTKRPSRHAYLRLDEEAIVVVSKAGPDSRSADDVSFNDLAFLSAPVGHHLEADPVAGQLLDVRDVDGAGARPGIRLGTHASNPPFRELDDFSPS